jgi:hypothetical protein
MIEERDANPTADTPGRFRGRRAPTALTTGGTESSEMVARLSGTESSNPLPSSGESRANLNWSRHWTMTGRGRRRGGGTADNGRATGLLPLGSPPNPSVG